MLDPNPHAELRVPRPGGRTLATVGYSLVVIFSFVATCNLLYANRIPVIAIAASLLWLGLVGFVVFSNVRDEHGFRQYIVNRLGRYSGYHFVRATPATGKADSISIGYSMFGRDQVYLLVDTKAISSIEWSSGQATAMSGRDMDDWNVAMWHHHPEGPQRKPFPGVRSEEVFIIGPSGPRATAETFGKQLVEFLVTAGVELTPGKDTRGFNTPARRTAIERNDPPERE